MASVNIGDQESEIVRTPSPECRKLWDRKSGELQDDSCGRFFARTTNSQITSANSDDATEEENDVCMNLQKFIATNF